MLLGITLLPNFSGRLRVNSETQRYGDLVTKSFYSMSINTEKHSSDPDQPDLGEINMAVPKKKTSKSRRDMRRSHQALKQYNAIKCSNCGELKRSHHICWQCGYHDNRDVLGLTIPSVA